MPADQPTTVIARPPGRPVTRLSMAVAAALTLVVLAGCGSSDKPAYCEDRSNLESAVKELPSLAKSANLSGLQTQVDTIKTDATTLADTIPDQADGPMAMLEQSELRSQLAAAIDRMPEREKVVLTLYYYENLTLAEIGRVLGVTESRVCQIHTKAVLQLRSRLIALEREPA